MVSTPFHAYYTARILDSLQDDDKFMPAFASSDIKVYPYQVGAALFATRSPYSKGVVLMDESGLGKSTEAMLQSIKRVRTVNTLPLCNVILLQSGVQQK